MLPILDNFDQAIAPADSEVMKGFEMIYVSLKQVLSDLGVVEIEAENQPFNPEFHNCITTEATNDENLNETIACIFQKGYMSAETNEVVRPATVSVYKLN